MKTKDEIEQLKLEIYRDIKGGIGGDYGFFSAGFNIGYTQCQEDMANEIQSLIDGYNSDILLLEEEFRDSSSVLIVEKMVTLADVIHNLYKTINK